MTEEEKVALAAKQAEEEAQANSSKAQDEEHQDDDKKSTEVSAQLEAQLKVEREAREEAERKLNATREKARERWEKRREQDDNEDDEEKPLTASQLGAILAKEREATKKELQMAEISKISSDLAENDTERELIVEIHKNRSFPAHLSLRDQLEECYVIANKKRLIGQRDEALRALKGKQGVSNDASVTHHDAPASGEPSMASQDKGEMTRLGFKWNGNQNRYEKRLSDGKVLVHDYKAKKNYVVKG